LDYYILDSGNHRKLEKVGSWIIIRPCAQAIWSPSCDKETWRQAAAEFIRDSSGRGAWKFFNKKLPQRWQINLQSIKVWTELTAYGHLGFFPEHHQHAETILTYLKERKQKKVLNLFAYTGVTSLILAAAGIDITHVDASKASIDWAKENSKLQSIKAETRWLLDDVMKFCKKEIRRGNKYDGIIVDPPSFGRGPKGELWKKDNQIKDLLYNLKEIVSKEFFILFTSHSPGYTPIVLTNLLDEITTTCKGKIQSDEMYLLEKHSKRKLPCGTYALFCNYNP
jgi:23S rRNA (cytosine1962-C5)-methyltransferase